MQYYVYAHLLNDTDLVEDVFYIGKGIGDRARRKSHRNNYWKHTVAKNNNTFYVKYLQTNIPEELSFFYEKLYIEIFGKKIEGGLLVNMTDGGEGASGNKCSEETKIKLSKANKGRKYSKELREKFSFITRGEKNPRYGVKCSEETKSKISKANKGKLSHDKHPKWAGYIQQYDKNMKLINTYISSREASEKTGITQSNIKSCANGTYGYKTAGGYYWIRKTVKQL